MPRSKPHKDDYERLLIVEGPDDKHSVIGLMKGHIEWPEDHKAWPVFVEEGKSVDEILRAGYLATELKASNVRTMGVVLDADDHAAGRYQRLRDLLLPIFPTLPPELPVEGLIVESLEDGKRFGAWIMPDNRSVGSMETFLERLVPASSANLFVHARQSSSDARTIGAPYRDVDQTRALIYTWLAWQDPPGQSPGIALTKSTFDRNLPASSTFVTWFRELYQLPPLTPPAT